jgi:sulfhydrogenase subunit beta (sulfur reductase)
MGGTELLAPVVLPVGALDALIADLRADGYHVLGPTVRDGAIVHGELHELGDLPRGWTDEQEPGGYRLVARDDEALFGFAVGPTSPRRTLFPPRQRLWTAVSEGDATFRIDEAEHVPTRLAFLGLRPCEVAAITIQDRILLHGRSPDEVYVANRSDALLLAVECGTPGGTCFCASMGTGPGLEGGADLVLTELLDGEHRLLARAGSAAGAALLDRLDGRAATSTDLAARDRVLTDATAAMGRVLDTDGLHDTLLGNLEHPRWDDVADRCLACTNCTLVCPTCFCTTVEDTTDLTGEHAFRDRRWDSCFTLEFSHAGPASVRTSTKARYRQWMTHKLATWIDQFGTSGCVGCGRCITWCPVGIDLTEEAAAIQATSGTGSERRGSP